MDKYPKENEVPKDLEVLQDSDVSQAGNIIIFSPNIIKIERIPFSTEERVRGRFW